MASAAQFASLDGTALQTEENTFEESTIALARRSISIFSRRGTEIPEPKPLFFAQAAMRVPTKLMERQKEWSKRQSAPPSSSPAKPRATILNAVPPAKTIAMTVLEEEMATSPNDEILFSIGNSPTSPLSRGASLLNLVSPVETRTLDKKNSAVSLTRRTQSQQRRDTNTRIGVWADGVVHWDDDTRQERAGVEEPSLQDVTGFTPISPSSAEGLNANRTTRPQLSVVIPGRQPLVNDTTISTVVQPMPQRPVVSVAPANIVSKFETPTISITYEDSQPDVLSSVPTPPIERPRAPVPRVAADRASKQLRQSQSSASTSSVEHDDGSDYSNRSSATSLASIAEPVKPAKGKSKVAVDVNKPLPPNPIPTPQREAPFPPLEPTPVRHSSTKTTSGVSVKRHTSFRSIRHIRSSPSLAHENGAVAAGSPTLSEAEDDLEAHLSIFKPKKGQPADSVERDTSDQANADDIDDTESIVARMGSVYRYNSVRSMLQPPERVPTIPKRSRKRLWRSESDILSPILVTTPEPARQRAASLSDLKEDAQQDEEIQVVRRTRSAEDVSKDDDVAWPLNSPTERLLMSLPKIVIDDGLIVVSGPVFNEIGKKPKRQVTTTSASAEDILLHILTAVSDTNDLFNTAIINKGMYRVYKHNEMDLIRTVTLNQSPAAAEFREWCPPEEHDDASSKSSQQLEHTPKSYMSDHQRDLAVIESLKSLILERCHSFIRRETAFALSTPSHPNAQRFNDAFWRIWCFCKIFGCAKGREEDVSGMLDWIRGAVLANNDDLTATMNMNFEYDMISVLLNPPDFFAQGNQGGLTAQQLYDMTEIWMCLRTLLEGYHGRTEQAWESGVFDDCEIGIGDEETEEMLLEEWTSYLMTLGPKVVLEMARFSQDTSSTGFVLAKGNGWAKWSPLESGSRNTFLKEPVSRLYEERVTAAAKKLHQTSREKERKEQSRNRVATLAAEIKLARQSSVFKHLPLIDMTMERPWSAMSRQTSTRSTTSMRSQSSMQPQPPASGRLSAPPALRTSRVPNFSVPRPQSPPAGLWTPRRISPIIEDRVESFNRMSLQNFAPGVAEDTGDIAIKRITDMGFSDTEAREALRKTDMGDGLRVDRAVDLLLRQHG